MNKFNIDEIANGYVEMGALNLAISQECFEAESQAWRLGDARYEMDTKTTKGDAQ